MARDFSAEVEDEERFLGLRNEEPEQEGENNGERTDNEPIMVKQELICKRISMVSMKISKELMVTRIKIPLVKRI